MNRFVLILSAAALLCSSCDTKNEPAPIQTPLHTNEEEPVPVPFPPQFITVNYIELEKIERISKFRSGIGHDYSDGSESCRSMKHYFQPKSSVDWSQIKIFSPVNGTIVRMFDEWAGTQLQIQPSSEPSCTIIIFHIALQGSMAVGDSVSAGQLLGTHIGSQTMSDIAVGFSMQNQWKLYSFFDVMGESLFQQYTARGISSRNDCIISKEARDADPLNCSGETFGSSGTLPNWVMLQ